MPRTGESWREMIETAVAIYGPNASGKTTLLDAIRALAVSVRNPGDGAVFQPSKQGRREDLTKYRVNYVSEGVRYEYQVSAAHWGIQHEALFSYPKGSRRRLFERNQESAETEMTVVKGSSLTGPTREVQKITRPHMLLLAVALQYAHPQLTEAASGLALGGGIDHLSFAQMQDASFLHRVVGEMVNAPDVQEPLVTALLKAGDLGLEGVDIKKDRMPPEIVEKFLRMVEVLSEGDGSKEQVAAEINDLHEVLVFRHQVSDGETFDLGLEHESSGTKTWLAVSWNALNALRKGSVLLVDELDASLHPEMVRYIVELFQSEEINSRGAQLIFTTHDVSLLGNAPTRLLEPSSVWFVEKDRSGVSELFSLDEFDQRSGNNNQRRYLAGQFGALPQVDESLLLRHVNTVAWGG